jgi:hypothetical protein
VRRKVISDEPVLLEDVSVESAGKCPDPDHAAGIFMEARDLVVTQAVRVGGVTSKDRKRIAVVQVETVFASEPEEPTDVLQDADHDALREALVDRYPVKDERRSLRGGDGESA